jgi:hypothetical protein
MSAIEQYSRFIQEARTLEPAWRASAIQARMQASQVETQDAILATILRRLALDIGQLYDHLDTVDIEQNAVPETEELVGELFTKLGIAT